MATRPPAAAAGVAAVGAAPDRRATVVMLLKIKLIKIKINFGLCFPYAKIGEDGPPRQPQPPWPPWPSRDVSILITQKNEVMGPCRVGLSSGCFIRCKTGRDSRNGQDSHSSGKMLLL